jgi:hypothetical protein
MLKIIKEHNENTVFLAFNKEQFIQWAALAFIFIADSLQIWL